MSPTEDWKLPGRAERCSGCQGPLAAGTLVTTLVRLSPAGPERRDLCASCGESVDSQGDELFWRRLRPEGDGPRRVVDYAMLRELFGRMLGRPDELYRRLSYLVALVLIRKRHLRLQGFEVRNGREVMVVTRGPGEPPLDVPAPFLTAEDMVGVRGHLTRLLNADLQDHDLPELAEVVAAPAPTSAAAAAAAAATEDAAPRA